jgi:hypothetical protein
MGRTYPSIDSRLRAFVEAQRIFFVATAPSGPSGHVNLSPKGLDSFRILDEQTVAYMDLVGSGVETIAHLRDNGRICVMFCAFEGPPTVLRLHGRGEVVEPQDRRFDELRPMFPDAPAGSVRSIIVARLTRISDSCGYGVPLYHQAGDRPQLTAWAERKGPSGLHQYQRDKNGRSIDGGPGLQWTGQEPDVRSTESGV